MVQWVDSHARVPDSSNIVVEGSGVADTVDHHQTPHNSEVPVDIQISATKAERLNKKRLQRLSEEGVQLLPIFVQSLPATPAPLYRVIASIISLLQWSIILICLANPLHVYEVLSSYFLGHATPAPAFIHQMAEGRWQFIGLTFFLGNLFKGVFTNLSAFEIFLGDSLVFSGTETGRAPSVEDLLTGLQRAGAVILH